MLRLFTLVYFSAVGVSLPFFAPYLRNLGLTGRQISAMLAVAPFCHLGVPLFWGWLADRTRRPDLLLRLACLGSFLAYIPMIFVRTWPTILPVFILHQFFAVAIPGLLDALAQERIRNHGDDYGRIRVWGSFSFTALCLALSPILADRGPRGGDVLVPTTLTILLGGAFVTSLFVRGGGLREAPHASDIKLLLADKRFRLLLLIAPLHWAATAPYHGFFSILLGDRGLSAQIIGNSFVVAVVGEMAAFLFLRNLRDRFRLSTLIAVSIGFSVIRWAVIATSTSPAVLVGVQLIHALTFGLFHGVAVGWLGEVVSPKVRATGQTLYTASVYGLGNLFGMVAAGALYDLTGGATFSFGAAAVLELVPLTILLLARPRLRL